MRVLAIPFNLLILMAFALGCRSLDSGQNVTVAHDPPLPAEESSATTDGDGKSQPLTETASTPASPRSATAAATPTVDVAPQTTVTSKSPTPDNANIQQAIAALVAAGSLDRAAAQRLAADLQQSDPALRAQVVQLLRDGLESRQATSTHASRENEHSADNVAAKKTDDSDRAANSDQPPRRRRSRQAINVAHTEAEPSHDAKIETADADEELPRTLPATAQATKQAEVPAAATPIAPVEESAADKGQPVARQTRDWQGHLSLAIEGLSGKLQAKPQTSDEIAEHAAMRLLYLIDGQRDLAVKPIPGVPPAQQDFWSKELYGLASYLDSERNPNPARRAAEAASHLREATARLGELASLSVRNLALCTEVKSYGIYKKFDNYEFIAAQEVLLYAEVENFKSVHSERGYHTALRSSCEILDQHGARVIEHEFPLTEEYCQNPRRDFFIRYHLNVPPQIYGGKYTLHLYIVDEHSQKMDHGSIEFTIKSKSN